MAKETKIINFHSSGNSAPEASSLEFGEIAVGHSTENPRLYIKKNDNSVTEFVDKAYIDDLIGDIETILDAVLHEK